MPSQDQNFHLQTLPLARLQHLQETPNQMHAPRHQNHHLAFPLPPLTLLPRNIPTPPHRLLNTPLHLNHSLGIHPPPRLRQPPLHLQLPHRRRVRVHTHEIGPVPLIPERDVGAEDRVREGSFVPEGGGEGAVEGCGEGVGVAGLLVEEEDAGSFGFGFGFGRGGGRGRSRRGGGKGDLGREPRCCEFDALERVPAIDVPCDVLLAAGFAPAGPADLFQAADEFRGELVVGVAGLVA